MATDVYKQIFDRQIEKELRNNNAFLTQAKDRSANLSGRIVNMYYEGQDPDTIVNAGYGDVPLAIGNRTDGVFTYRTNDISTLPTLVQESDEVLTAYQKVMSVKDQHSTTVAQEISEWAIYNWLRDYAGTDGDSGGNIPTYARLLTSGAPATEFNNPAGDGLRLKASLQDVQRARLVMNKQNVPTSGRIAVLSAQMETELFGTDNTRYSVNAGGAQNISGELGDLFGFKVYSRASAGLSTGGVIQAPGSAITTATDDTSFFFHKDMVHKADGMLRTFAQFDRGEYLGDIFNLTKRFASHRDRNDAFGVVTLTQAPVTP